MGRNRPGQEVKQAIDAGNTNEVAAFIDDDGPQTAKEDHCYVIGGRKRISV